jgi:hypothetical protein
MTDPSRVNEASKQPNAGAEPQNLPVAHTQRARHDSEEEFPVEALQNLIELERERLESTNRRTEIIRYAIETNDSSDKRQFDYRMAKLETDKSDSNQRFSLARAIAYISSGVIVVTVLLLFYMAFFGDARQSEIAFTIMKTLATGAGGYGVIAGLVRAGTRLLSKT